MRVGRQGESNQVIADPGRRYDQGAEQCDATEAVHPFILWPLRRRVNNAAAAVAAQCVLAGEGASRTSRTFCASDRGEYGLAMNCTVFWRTPWASTVSSV